MKPAGPKTEPWGTLQLTGYTMGYRPLSEVVINYVTEDTTSLPAFLVVELSSSNNNTK
jgi:hypothetical protein